MEETRNRRIGWAWVIAQFALLAAFVFLFPAGREPWPAPVRLLALPLGAAAFALGLGGVRGIGRRLTPSPVPSREGALVTSGVYRRVRHPMYGAVLLAALAWAILRSSPSQMAGMVPLLLFFLAKSTWEERRLSERFPEYGDYRRRTRRFLPCLF